MSLKIKTLVLASLFSFGSIAANAQDVAVDENYDPRSSYTFEFEEGAMQESTEQIEQGVQMYGIGSIIKKIVKGIIIAESLDRDHGRGGYRGQVTCFAQSRRGETFRAAGNRPNQVQNKAMDKCLRNAVQCRPLGCQTDRW